MGETIKVNFRKLTELEVLPTRVWAVESKSEPGRTHIIMKLATGLIVCTCDGWQKGNKCWHVDEANG